MSRTVPILIIASLICALVGVVLTVVRARKFVRGQRARENEIRIQSVAAEHKLKDEPEATQE